MQIDCLCQSINIKNNKYVYCQIQVRKLTGSEVTWAECSLIILTGYRIQVFSLILDSSLVCEWAFSLPAILCRRLPGFKCCIQQGKTTCLLSNRFSNRLPVPEHWYISAYVKFEASVIIHKLQMFISNIVDIVDYDISPGITFLTLKHSNAFLCYWHIVESDWCTIIPNRPLRLDVTRKGS